MKYILINYNFDPSWVKDYTDDYLVYDRSDDGYDWCQNLPPQKVIYRENIGSDIYDKFSFIIDNYDNLPDVAIYTKSNLFKYISKEEFEEVKDNLVFTPLLTQNHKTYLPICWYEDGLYCEINNYWYLGTHPVKHLQEIKEIFKMDKREYNKFAPGSNYILTKKDILKHSKSFYEKLRSFLSWGVYPGDAQLLERNLYYLWATLLNMNLK